MQSIHGPVHVEGVPGPQGGRRGRQNYLSSDEINMLNMLTTQFIDLAELRARRRQQITHGQVGDRH